MIESACHSKFKVYTCVRRWKSKLVVLFYEFVYKIVFMLDDVIKKKDYGKKLTWTFVRAMHNCWFTKKFNVLILINNRFGILSSIFQYSARPRTPLHIRSTDTPVTVLLTFFLNYSNCTLFQALKTPGARKRGNAKGSQSR